MLFDGLSGNHTEKLLQLTARLSLFNLPEVGFDIARVTGILQRAGMTRGSYTTPSGVNLTAAVVDAVNTTASIRQDPIQFSQHFVKLGNDWSQLRANYSGDFKQHYTVRAFVAAQGYLQLKASQAMYPVYNLSGQLNSGNSYTVTFSKKPPVTGFWSLTVYDEKAYLVPNRWNIYSLGDRSGIKYRDGTLVYPGSSHEDEEFTILLQTLDKPPPEKYQSK